MGKVIGTAVLIIGVCLIAYLGCGPRVNVAKDAAIKKIDDLLGPLNVKQKEVEMAYDELKNATAGIRDKRIEAQVRVKAMQAKQADYEQEKQKLVADLGKLKTMLADAESTGSIERDGKEIPIEKLKTIADGTVKKVKLLNDQIKKNQTIADAWAKNLDILKKQDETSKTQLAKLEGQLEQIRSKKLALDGMREAATIAGPGTSISDKFNELSESVDELMVSIDTKWAIEEEKLNERIAEVEQDADVSLDELLDDKTDVSSVQREIDELLKSEGGGN